MRTSKSNSIQFLQNYYYYLQNINIVCFYAYGYSHLEWILISATPCMFSAGFLIIFPFFKRFFCCYEKWLGFQIPTSISYATFFLSSSFIVIDSTNRSFDGNNDKLMFHVPYSSPYNL